MSDAEPNVPCGYAFYGMGGFGTPSGWPCTCALVAAALEGSLFVEFVVDVGVAGFLRTLVVA